MSEFNREIRRIVEENPQVATQLRKAFPDSFPGLGKFIIHTGIGREDDPAGTSSLYFFCEEKENTSYTSSRYMVNLDGTWSNPTSDKYPDEYNKLFTGTLKVEDGVLIEVNET
ncbi:MAG: hypothetical protein WC503_04050 [Candidatus Shapirobacteria bacterium]